MTTGSERAELVPLGWHPDPNLYGKDLIPEPAYQWQERVLELFYSGARRVAVKSPRGAGKTALIARLAWWFLCTRPDTLVAVVTPVARQARHGVMTEIRRIWDSSPDLRALFPFEVFDFEIRTPRPAWRLVAWSAGDDLDALEGLHGPNGVLLLVDEAKGLPDEVWSRLQPMLRGPESRVLAVSTPGPRSGWFWEAFTNGTREQFDETVSITLDDCPHIQELAARESKRLGRQTALYRQQFEAEFADVEDAPLFPIPLIERCRRDPDGPEEKDPDSLKAHFAGPPRERRGGFDPAGLGTNDSAMAFIVGRCTKEIRILPKLEPMALCVEAIRQAKEWRITTLSVDATGLGAPLASRMRELAPPNLRIHNYVAGGQPFEGAGANFKTSVALRLRELLLEGTFGFDLPNEDFARLTRELSALQLTTEFKSGRVRVVDPSRSPDVADSVLVALSSYVCNRVNIVGLPRLGFRHGTS